MHEHPTQALLDAFTMRQHLGPDLQGKTVAICGDILHSRVARSNALLLKKLGARVRLAGPQTMLPHRAKDLGWDVHNRIEPALEGADVVMMLRIQLERIGGPLFPTTREYSRVWGLNERRLALAKPDAIVAAMRAAGFERARSRVVVPGAFCEYTAKRPQAALP